MNDLVRNLARSGNRLLQRGLGVHVVRAADDAPNSNSIFEAKPDSANHPRSATAEPGAARDAEHAPFLPRGDKVRGGWSVPTEFAGMFDSAWWKVLAELYARPHAWPGSVSPQTGLLLHALVLNIRPRLIVETGTCHGASTIWMASALAAAGAASGAATGTTGRLHTFDLYQLPEDSKLRNIPLFRNQAQQVRQRIRDAGLSAIATVHEGDSSSGITELAKTERHVEFAYLDGDHSIEGARADFKAIDPLIPPGGYVVLHDVFPHLCGWTGPRQLLDQLSTWTRDTYQMCDLYTAPNNYGVTILRKTHSTG